MSRKQRQIIANALGAIRRVVDTSVHDEEAANSIEHHIRTVEYINNGESWRNIGRVKE
jgi:hypothetical protein